MKKIILRLSILLVVIGLSVAYTFAFLTDTDYAVNEFYPSYVDVQVVEGDSYIEDGSGITFDTSESDGLATKVFSIANSNENNDPDLILTAAWIRVAVVATVLDQYGNVKPIDGSAYITFNTAVDGGSDTNWSLGADGYYYYALPVNPEQMTGQLVIDMEKPGSDFLEVSVLAEGLASRQITNYGESITDIW